MEKALPVSIKVKDDENIEEKDDENRERKARAQLINFNRYKKRRLSDGQPARPTDPEHQADPFHQRKQAVENRPGGKPANIGGRDGIKPVGKVGKDFLFRVDVDPLQQMFELVRKIRSDEFLEPERQEKERQPL